MQAGPRSTVPGHSECRQILAELSEPPPPAPLPIGRNAAMNPFPPPPATHRATARSLRK